jgi:galactokinase
VTGVTAVTDAYLRLMGQLPGGAWVSPGRVNLIGEHTDYNDGLVLPLTVDRTARVAAGLSRDTTVRCCSLQFAGAVTVAVADIEPGRARGWEAYPLGVLWAMARAGLAVPGVDLVIDSDIPAGAGLGSSAAVEVAVALAVAELTGQALSSDDVARFCQAGEQSIAGAPTGLMDQLAVLEGGIGQALLLDCRTMARELVPFHPADAGLTLLVIDTTVVHATSGHGYRARRDECRLAARELGVASLRDASLEAIGAHLTGVLQRRARHVATENARVTRAAALLRSGAWQQIGELLNSSHASLRDDFEVSCPELDLAAEIACAAGAWGARMTGAGFGGSAIALLPSDRCDAVTDALSTAFAHHRHRVPNVFPVTTAEGARRCA